MVNSVPCTHTRYPFVPDFFFFFLTQVHMLDGDGLIGSENLFDASYTLRLQFGGLNVTVVSKRVKYIPTGVLILQYSCALL
jgi:hypothetical protein